jgi:thiamine pyrophosphokinase
MNVLIFANGVMADLVWVRPYLETAAAILAADGGTRHLLALGHAPDVVIGDMDSLPPEAEVLIRESGAVALRYPESKDETDLELALLYAAEHYPEADLLLFGAIGGRLDQTLANILLLAHPALAGRCVRLLEGRETAWLVDGETVIDGVAGDTVSLIPLDGAVHVAETQGLRWPLHDETLAFGPARGVSNQMVASRAVIRLRTGRLLCIHTRRET